MLKVLIADDDPDIRMLMFMAARRADLDVHSVTDGLVAQFRLLNEPFDVAVLDVSMPNKSGLEVTRAVRSDRDVKGIGIILVSAHSSEADVEAGRRAGADVYLAKPFSIVELVDSIVEVGKLVQS